MTEAIGSIREVPERFIVSGDGLREMELSHFKTLVSTLGRMGLTVERIEQADSDVMNRPESQAEDTILYKSDFMRVATSNDLDKNVESKTWNCLIREWSYFAKAKRKQTNGVELSDFDRRYLAGLPVWRQDLCPDDGEVSFVKLRVAYES